MQTEMMATDRKMKISDAVKSWKIGSAMVALTTLGLLSGCGKGREYGSVSGRVTCQGRPVSEGVIIFADEEWSNFMTAPIRDGQYSVSATDRSGLYVDGQYQVAVLPPAAEAPMGQIKPAAQKTYRDIPSKYRDWKTSGLKFDLTGKSGTFDVDMKP